MDVVHCASGQVEGHSPQLCEPGRNYPREWATITVPIGIEHYDRDLQSSKLSGYNECSARGQRSSQRTR